MADPKIGRERSSAPGNFGWRRDCARQRMWPSRFVARYQKVVERGEASLIPLTLAIPETDRAGQRCAGTSGPERLPGQSKAPCSKTVIFPRRSDCWRRLAFG